MFNSRREIDSAHKSKKSCFSNLAPRNLLCNADLSLPHRLPHSQRLPLRSHSNCLCLLLRRGRPTPDSRGSSRNSNSLPEPAESHCEGHSRTRERYPMKASGQPQTRRDRFLTLSYFRTDKPSPTGRKDPMARGASVDIGDTTSSVLPSFTATAAPISSRRPKADSSTGGIRPDLPWIPNPSLRPKPRARRAVKWL